MFPKHAYCFVKPIYGKQKLLNLYTKFNSMKLFFAFLFVVAGATAAFVFAPNSKPVLQAKQIVSKQLSAKNTAAKDIEEKNRRDKQAAHLKLYGQKAEAYVKANNFCEDYYFVVDMKIAPGKKRFFIYDLKNDSIIDAGLVTHGGGSETKTDSLVFCNIPSSGSTSLGKYKIGVEYSGQFGMAFKLHGLEASNSKAFERFVVLHSHSCVPAEEVYPAEICTSLGCPTVNPGFLPILKKHIDKSEKPVLLWIIY
jgi:L,D-transpeptidase catalytic domain